MIDVSKENKKLNGFNFIDLFAGIGGFHYALTSYGAKCVFASEWDKKASQTYYENHKLKPFGDITSIDEKSIPKHDILCGGFPCQAFSISGKQKGFIDTRGTLFFDIARIANYHNPKILFLENVKNLLRHDEGRTMSVIENTLSELGYSVKYKVLNTSNYGLPQNRERVYILGFRNDIDSSNFTFPKPKSTEVSLNDFLEMEPVDGKIIERDDMVFHKKYIPEENLFGKANKPNRPIQIGIVNKGGQGERIYHPDGHAITLSAYGGGVGGKTGLYYIDGKVRKLSPRECARIQGFPNTFQLHDSTSESHKQFGNSVSINVLQEILGEVVKLL